MALLDDAQKVYVGTVAATEIYVGDILVWTPPALQVMAPAESDPTTLQEQIYDQE